MSRNEPDEARAPFAFLADLHGNLLALDAVLQELRDRDVGSIFVAGDLLFPGPDPVGVWKRLQEVGARCVRGSSDLALARVEPGSLRPASEAEGARLERFRATREALGDLVLARLRRLPQALRLTLPGPVELTVLHGSPTDPYTDLNASDSDEELEALLGPDPGDVVVCGGSHTPFLRQVGDVQVVGLGSVGEAPEGRVAHFTLLGLGGVFEHLWVPW
ncbi:MAG: metallophosphoesterase family protein [Deltaproteobacteria bacterium]|nr:metallophosphoesterase family protein [Deltaproteobacteria bacterium]